MLFTDFSRFPRHRLSGEITPDIASRVVQWLLDYGDDKDDDLLLLLNSSGGCVASTLSIYDAIRLVPSRVHILTTGMCQSAAVTLITATERSRRYATSNTRFMMHPASQCMEDGRRIICSPDMSDLEALRTFDEMTGARSTELHALQARLIEILAKNTFLPEAKVREFFTRDHFFWPETAVEYGVIGEIIKP